MSLQFHPFDHAKRVDPLYRTTPNLIIDGKQFVVRRGPDARYDGFDVDSFDTREIIVSNDMADAALIYHAVEHFHHLFEWYEDNKKVCRIKLAWPGDVHEKYEGFPVTTRRRRAK